MDRRPQTIDHATGQLAGADNGSPWVTKDYLRLPQLTQRGYRRGVGLYLFFTFSLPTTDPAHWSRERPEISFPRQWAWARFGGFDGANGDRRTAESGSRIPRTARQDRQDREGGHFVSGETDVVKKQFNEAILRQDWGNS